MGPVLRPPLPWPTWAQVLRQLGIAVAVAAVWGLLLIGYLGLTREAAPSEPTSVAVVAQPSASPSVQPPSGTPEPTPTASATPEAIVVSFSADVLPIFESSCNRCHGSSGRAGLSLLTPADVLAGSSNGPVIVPGSAADSPLVESVETGRMPRGTPRLPDEAIQIVRDWIDAGAPDN